MFYIDGHCDTLSKALDENKKLLENDLQFTFDKAEQIGGGIQVMACFIDPQLLTYENAGFDRCNAIIGKFEEFQKENNIDCLVKNKTDINNALNGNNVNVLLSIENGSAISNDINNVDYFYNKGIRMMSLTWNDDNELGCGAKTKNDTGLTELGIKCVKKINDLGMILDVSHLSEKSFWDVVSATDKPIVASHSNTYQLCNNSRNLKDDQIKAIAKSGGIIGVCYYSDFLNDKRKATVKDVVEHIKYIKNLVGIDYIGLGSDYDGMSLSDTADELEDISMLNNIRTELKNQGFNDEEITKIMWNNWSKVFKKNIK